MTPGDIRSQSRGVDQAVAVVHGAPRGDANGDNLTFVVAAAQAEVMHSLAHLLHYAGVGPPGDDPSSCGLGHLDQASAEDALQLGLHVKVLGPARD